MFTGRKKRNQDISIYWRIGKDFLKRILNFDSLESQLSMSFDMKSNFWGLVFGDIFREEGAESSKVA